MGFNFGSFIRNPIKRISKVARNPAAAIVPAKIRASKVYRNIGRPIIKIAAAVAIGAATGGVSVGLSGVAFSGLSVAGAVAGGLSSAVNGGLTSRAFSPVKDALIPAAAGFVAGNAARNMNAIDSALKATKKQIISESKKGAMKLFNQVKVTALSTGTGVGTSGVVAASPVVSRVQVVQSGQSNELGQSQESQSGNGSVAMIAATVGLALLSS